jgi:hypothetical protein
MLASNEFHGELRIQSLLDLVHPIISPLEQPLPESTTEPCNTIATILPAEIFLPLDAEYPAFSPPTSPPLVKLTVTTKYHRQPHFY